MSVNCAGQRREGVEVLAVTADGGCRLRWRPVPVDPGGLPVSGSGARAA